MKKKILSILLAAAVITGTFAQPVMAASTDTVQTATENQAIVWSNSWFGDQLEGRALSIYQAFTDLSASMISGKAVVELVANGYISQDDVQAYLKGDTSLAEEFQQARDAFFYDHPEFFYVDQTKLTLRVGMKGNTAAAEIGTGTNQTYFTEGFETQADAENAVAQTQAQLDAITASVTGTTEEMIRSIHDTIIAGTEYTTADQAGEDAAYVDGAFGALVKGKAVCGGYAQAFKLAMDKLSIPCVLVYGIGENSNGVKEEHQWNYVQVDGQWFAVDVTWDDPIGGEARDLYLLNGAADFTGHFAGSNLSPNGKSFTYPELFGENLADAGKQQTSQDLLIKAVDGADEAGDLYTTYEMSYKGMGVKEAYKKDKVIFAGRFSTDGVNWNPWVDLSLYAGVEDENKITFFQGYIQFAVTNKAMDGRFMYKTDLSQEGMNLSMSEPYKVTQSPELYVAPPTLIRSTPSVQSAMEPGTYKVSITFSENLEQIGDININVNTSQKYLDYKIDNISWSNGSEDLQFDDLTYTRNTSTVTFDFTTDDTYNTHDAVYDFGITGLQGVTSHKEPRNFSYLTKIGGTIDCGIYSTLFSGVSTLKVTQDDITNYNGGGGKTGFFLTATKGGESQTYALGTGCSSIAEDAAIRKHVTLAVPYPEGYDVRHDGDDITFTAISMEKQAEGIYVAVEAECVITEKGLEVRLER